MKSTLYSSIISLIRPAQRTAPRRSNRQRWACIALFLILSFAFGQLRAQKMYKDCCDPDFGSATLYYSVQAGSPIGFGVEAGQWNKEKSRFSYFLGSRLQWFQETLDQTKPSNTDQTAKFYLYMKGQMRVVSGLYLVVAPELVNLSTLDATTGIRFVIPVGQIMGIGLEPTYSIVSRQFSFNTNFHFAL
jgi:hypothetical protein